MIERTRNTKRETRNKINNMEKKIYSVPCIEIILLDNEISLALESAPPAGPDETMNYNQQSPFKQETGLV